MKEVEVKELAVLLNEVVSLVNMLDSEEAELSKAHDLLIASLRLIKDRLLSLDIIEDGLHREFDKMYQYLREHMEEG